MKQLLTRIIEYKLNPYDFPVFVNTLTTLVKDSPESKMMYHKDELHLWLNELRTRRSNQPLSENDHEVIEGILYKIEELIVHEMVFMAKASYR
ncbi:MAG: hypothetical protein Q8Q56_05495 [Alphaproteobacteria bacterium]|nr:hypothetical protein [Methylococcaceae bacterium]MDP3936416.1 hypothetical protein [Alphaproteobacteria bacterium]